MLTDILKLVLDPKLLAAAGGYAGHRWLGKGKPSWQPYAYAAGGALAGYALGSLAQKYLPLVAPPAAAPVPAAVKAAGQVAKQLPAATIEAEFVEMGPAAGAAINAAVDAEASEEDNDVLDSFTSSFEVDEEEV